MEAVKRLFKRPQSDFDQMLEHKNGYGAESALRRDRLNLVDRK